MSEGLDYASGGEWIRDTGPERDVVISSRIRLARNIEGSRFTQRADGSEQQQMVALAHKHAMDVAPEQNLIWIDLLESNDLERSLL